MGVKVHRLTARAVESPRAAKCGVQLFETRYLNSSVLHLHVELPARFLQYGDGKLESGLRAGVTNNLLQLLCIAAVNDFALCTAVVTTKKEVLLVCQLKMEKDVFTRLP